MKNFISAGDVTNVDALVEEAIKIKAKPFTPEIGHGKTLGLLFFNPSLRTRMSSQKAAQNLGMNTIVMDVSSQGWQLEFEDGAVMNGSSQEHIKDAVQTMSQYVDVLGVRTFAGLKNREEDYQELVLKQFLKYSDIPIISLESATLHPLQSLADLITIKEQNIIKPKVVLSWSAHPKPLPQAVANSFLEWVRLTDASVTLTCPNGFELAPQYCEGITIVNDQYEAFKGADVVYAKNWSSYSDYGKIAPDALWTINKDKMDLTNNAHFMHCLPVRRNVVASDAVLDSSIIYQQAKNRIYSAQTVIRNLII